jgi:hypothetical protein
MAAPEIIFKLVLGFVQLSVKSASPEGVALAIVDVRAVAPKSVAEVISCCLLSLG